jgi:hypothetical protein
LRRGIPLEQATVALPEAANEDAPEPSAKGKKRQSQQADTDDHT